MIKEKIKIVFVLPTLAAGGAERVLITLMNGLDPARFAPELIVLDEAGPLRKWIAEDIPLHSLGHLKVRNSLGKLIKKLNILAPDIIVSTMAAMNHGVLLIKPFLKKKAKIIIREAVIASSIVQARPFPWLIKTAYRVLYPRADMVICPAQCIIDEFKNDLRMDTKDFILLHNPVDMKRLCEEPPVVRTNAQAVLFIAAGRLHRQKGFDRLIEGLSGLKAENWNLEILGTGPEYGNLQELINKHRLEGKVILRGLAENPWKYIGAADALLLPSRWEGLPNVALEFMAVGTRVIGMAEAGGIREIAGLAAKSAVTVADTMEDFLQAMQNVKPDPPQTYRPSLLPEHFLLENVIRRFETLLETQ